VGGKSDTNYVASNETEITHKCESSLPQEECIRNGVLVL